MDLRTAFKRLGYGKNAHAIYASLLKSKNPLLVADIARVARLDRPEVYRNLAMLVAYSFIKVVVVGKRKKYAAQDPHVIEDVFKVAANGVGMLSEKLSTQRTKAIPEYIRYFSGPAGIRAVFDDVVMRMPRGGTFYRYTSERDLAAVNRYLSPEYRAVRDKKKLERLVISNPVSGKQKRSRLERFIKYIPPEADLFDHNIIQLVYADCLAFVNITTEEAFIIQDKALASFQTVIFNQLYKKLA